VPDPIMSVHFYAGNYLSREVKSKVITLLEEATPIQGLSIEVKCTGVEGIAPCVEEVIT
jgi:hypothetical protein